MVFFLLQLVWSYFKESILILVISSFFSNLGIKLHGWFYVYSFSSFPDSLKSCLLSSLSLDRAELKFFVYLVFTFNYVLLSEDKHYPQILCTFLRCGDWKLDGFSLQTSAIVSLFAWIHIDGNVHLWTLLQASQG